MAQKVEVQLIDDLEGGPADETVEFGLGGKRYEIDLKTDNVKKLYAFLDDYVGAARKASNSRTKTRTGTATAATPADRDRNQAIREWARGQGHDVADRGRIPSEVVDAYDTAH